MKVRRVGTFGGIWTGRFVMGNFLVLTICILIWMLATQVSSYEKNIEMCKLQCMHFNVCLLYLN